MEIQKLKKCPYCGSEARINNISKKLWGVVCKNYKECVAELTYFNNELDAIKAWNQKK